MTIAFGGFFFAIFAIQTQPTAVGVFGGVPAAGSSVLAIASMVAVKKRHEVERAWLAIGLFVFAIVLVIVVNLF
ncbi:hypothetical protein BU204_23210 [Actinophytocola xanthii]|uniref:Uncharacterized protein n=1 Tax=Actinophytocola xanthii TaxID=1912961 RepID=A0A1Q8CLE0_9PSEU|nr:hypothetical protein BU204_23210 [Actinophytocola xanthii]